MLKKALPIQLPKHRALSNIDLEKYAKLLKLKHFRGVFMKDQLPTMKIHKTESGIINLDNSTGVGTHWTAYKIIGKNIHYFDSFGNLRPPLESVKYFNSNGD
ncbi:unnamed protein product [Ceutorhynchus assimilis]|uniref:Uncharacterized protein n=1 Tax=Ceutorhynchus assimilis TaxID=467358 RepID=A0A9N9MTZ3_9CUCU|nr:unnamed protein product [Ceutorhynchus assimilis]